MKRGKLIAVICYDTIELWVSKKKAMDFYAKAARYCDGCEAERYANVVFDLMDGCRICNDGSSDDYATLKAKNRYHQFPNGTNIRDYTGKEQGPTGTLGLLPIPE